MKAFIRKVRSVKNAVRKIRTVKKRELIEKAVVTWVTISTLRNGEILDTPKPDPFFGNFNQSKPHMERSNPYHQTIIVNEESQFSTENQSVEKTRVVKFGFDRGLRIGNYNRDLSTQKSEFTYSQDEIEALGLEQDSEEVRLVVGLPMPRSSQFPLAGHEKNWDQLIQKSNIPINMEQLPKIVMSLTSTDVTNPKWIQEFICSIRAGSNEKIDEKLIKSILGKVAESELDVPSINKILERIVDATLSLSSNDKLMKILKELQTPIQPSVPQGAGSTEVVTIPDNLQKYQQKSKSFKSRYGRYFSNLVAPDWINFAPKKHNPVKWQQENRFSTPSTVSFLDSTKCYGHREAFDMPRSVTERFETNAVKNLAKTSLKNPKVKQEYETIKSLIEEGIHPINIGKKTTYVSSTKVLIKKPEGRYIVDVSDTEAQIIGLGSRSNKKSMRKFKNLMNKLYDLNIEGY